MEDQIFRMASVDCYSRLYINMSIILFILTEADCTWADIFFKTT